MIKRNVLAFVGGIIATLAFHQGLLALLHHFGILPMQAFNMAPTKPLGVPSVISLSFFGGLWGPLIWAFIFKDSQLRRLFKSIIYGAIGPTAVAFAVVLPLKGVVAPLTFIPIGLLLNGFWGFGLWCFMHVSAILPPQNN